MAFDPFRRLDLLMDLKENGNMTDVEYLDKSRKGISAMPTRNQEEEIRTGKLWRLIEHPLIVGDPEDLVYMEVGHWRNRHHDTCGN